MKTDLNNKEQMIRKYFIIFFINIIFIITILLNDIFPQDYEIQKHSDAKITLSTDINMVTDQLDHYYSIELFPGRKFKGWQYAYYTGGGIIVIWPNPVNYQEEPDVEWLKVTPSSFTIDYASDIQPVKFKFKAPVTPGSYTTTLRDTYGNAVTCHVTLTVTNNPTVKDSIFIQISSGQSVTLLDTIKWKGCGQIGPVSNYIPDNYCDIVFSEKPPVPWLTI